MYKRWRLWDSVRDRPRLSPDDIGALEVYYDDQNETFWQERASQKGGMAWNLVDMVDPLLSKQRIDSVVNVGGQVDRILSHLAGGHPDTTFTTVDFSKDLSKWNSSLPQHQNWKFQSGYALDLFESGALTGDLVMMSSTSPMFTNAELRAYIAAMAPNTRYIVFNEGWWLVGLRVVLPEHIDSRHSIIGGPYGNYHHNYISILEENGFEILSSKIVDDGFITPNLQIVARNQVHSNAVANEQVGTAQQ